MRTNLLARAAAAVLFASLMAPAVSASDVSEIASVSLPIFGGAVQVRSDHWAMTESLDAGSSFFNLRIRPKTFKDAIVVNSVTITNSHDSFPSDFIHYTKYFSGLCVTNEGVWSSTTASYLGSFPVWFSYGTAASGPLFLNCDPGPPCSRAITDTETLTLLMTEGSHQQVVIGLDFPLSRFEEREGEFFLLGEWAYLDGERVAQASSPAFSDAVASLPEVESASGFVIQAPRHVDNIRNIHLPAARFKVIDLPRSIAEQTKESPVQFYFRAEIDAQGQTRDVALYGEPAELSPEWLRLATLQRLVLDYHSTKRHPVDVFGQVHIAGSMKLVRSRVTLPQCCCGPLICS